MNKNIILILLTGSVGILLNTGLIACSEDLYDVLGVSRMSTSQEIKKAYKNLAKIWHPDKNKEPGATERFMKINEAYATLTDSDKRSMYDRHGYTSAQEPPVGNRGAQGFGGDFQGFFRNGQFGSFNFNFGGESIVDKYTISLRFYETRVIPESYRKPYFMYAYADLCFACMHYEPLIEKFIKELEEVGIGIGTIHVSSSRALASKLRLHEVPQIMAVINGKVAYIKGQVSMQILREFIRNLFPSNTIQMLTDKNVQEFLLGWSDNRVRALFLSPRDRIPVRFLMPAFNHRQKIASGFVNTKSGSGIGNILHRYNVNKAKDTLMIVAEDINASIAIVTMQSLSKGSVEEVMEANQYLTLPRLSSQTFFDELCPVESKAKHRKLCVILVTRKTEEHDGHRSLFRTYVQQAPTFQHRVKFMYIYKETQYQFVDTLMNGNYSSEIDEMMLKIAIVWRMDKNHMNYEWVEPGWSSENHLNILTCQNLEKRLQELFTNTNRLLYTAMLPGFYNEHALGGLMGFLTKITGQFCDFYDYVSMLVTGYDSKTWLSIWLSILSVAMVVLLQRRLLNEEMGNVKREEKGKRRKFTDSMEKPSRMRPSVHLYELCSKSYNNLVKNADACLTITLLVNKETQDKLLNIFLQVIEPYSRSTTLKFAFLQLDQYLDWYQQLLQDSKDLSVQLSKVNIPNCIGTVLAINGHRMYYYIFHSRNAQKWAQKVNSGNCGTMFGSDSDSDRESENILIDELLVGLDNWLDKIFDGMVHRIRVVQWPGMTSSQ